MRAPPVWRMAKLALAEPIAALWVLAHTMRTGVTRNRNADEPSFVVIYPFDRTGSSGNLATTTVSSATLSNDGVK